jgi:hypothetical protein
MVLVKRDIEGPKRILVKEIVFERVALERVIFEWVFRERVFLGQPPF